MITLRMLAIASAILVSLPIGFALAHHAADHVLVPGGEVVNYGLEAAAHVRDITLVEPPGNYDRVSPEKVSEQLVEGHTVFVTWDIQRVHNATPWSADVVGSIGCDPHVNVSGEYWGPDLFWPTRVDEAHVECWANGTVIVTPDPFYDSDDAQESSMQPTGRTIPFTTPTGQTGHATEYVYEAVSTDWLGESTSRTLYAWSVPVLDPWLHSDGGTKSWYCPLPVDRLQEMGITTFTARFESDSA